MVLCDRLNRWFKPYREQAGLQNKGGCLEHIVTLRLLTDMARRKKTKLFVTFEDFSKAYDLVPRGDLFRVLKRLGCGRVMLAALKAMYQMTESVIGEVVTATLGVRQASPSSCVLFILFVNDLIKLVKERCQPDGFLQWLHTLVLMDDSVLLATSRQAMTHKVAIVQEFCENYGIKINQSKTKFFVINGEARDTEPLRVNGLVIDDCLSYQYLGSPFTSDGSVSSAVKIQAKEKICHVLKFVSFLRKNNDIPFVVRRRVLDAALMSALLHGCESWVGACLKPLVKL